MTIPDNAANFASIHHKVFNVYNNISVHSLYISIKYSDPALEWYKLDFVPLFFHSLLFYPCVKSLGYSKWHAEKL